MAYQFSDARDATIKFQGQTNEAWNIGKVNGQATAEQTTNGITALLWLSDNEANFNMTDLLRTLKQNVIQV